MNTSAQIPVRRWLELAGKRVECALFQPQSSLQNLSASSATHSHWGAARLLLLHEGLGSIALWRDFPQTLANSLGEQVVAYSRYGYGQSEILAEARTADFMHREAGLPLISLRQQLGLRKPILIGHSDGASIALLHASANPGETLAVVALAPHVFVELLCIESIKQVSEIFQNGDLPQRMGRYHFDPVKTFEGWSQIWLAEEFKNWNIESDVARITCPVLAIQGHDDRFGSMQQIDRIAALLPRTELLKLDHCGHSPHLEQSDLTLKRIKQFIGGIDALHRTAIN